MRLFIAFDIPSEISETLKTVQDGLDTISADFTFSRSFHLTLKFLGEVSDLAEVKKRLSEIAMAPIDITLFKTGVFPDMDNIRVVFVGTKNPEPIIRLQQKIDDVLFDLFSKEKHFHPHFTIARVKYVKDKSALQKQIKTLVFPIQTFTVTSFKLYISTLTSGGPKYEEIVF